MSKRTAFHIFLGVVLWAVFAYYWHIVARRPVSEHTRFALAAVASVVVGITVFLVLWVIHNIRIARKKRRKTRLEPDPHPAVDFLGRPLLWHDPGSLKRAPYIEIHIVERSGDSDPGQKVFRILER